MRSKTQEVDAGVAEVSAPTGRKKKRAIMKQCLFGGKSASSVLHQIDGVLHPLQITHMHMACLHLHSHVSFPCGSMGWSLHH